MMRITTQEGLVLWSYLPKRLSNFTASRTFCAAVSRVNGGMGRRGEGSAVDMAVIGSSGVDVGVGMSAHELKGLHHVTAEPGSVIA
jgi:hypothetical protein